MNFGCNYHKTEAIIIRLLQLIFFFLFLGSETVCTVKKRPWEEVYQDEEEEDDDDEGKEHDYGDGDTEEQASQDYSSELSYSP